MLWEFLHEVVNFFEEWWVYLLTIILVLRTIAFFSNKRWVSMDDAVVTVNQLLQVADDTIAFEKILNRLYNKYCLVDYFILYMAHSICSKKGFFYKNYFLENFKKCLEIAEFKEGEIIRYMEYSEACYIIMLDKYYFANFRTNDDDKKRDLSDFAFSVVKIIIRRR